MPDSPEKLLNELPLIKIHYRRNLYKTSSNNARIVVSIRKTTKAMIREAMDTTIALLCSSPQVGQDTL
jgi:hypothetical protein